METRIRSPAAYQKRKLQSRSLDKTIKRKERGPDIGVFLAVKSYSGLWVSVRRKLKNIWEGTRGKDVWNFA